MPTVIPQKYIAGSLSAMPLVLQGFSLLFWHIIRSVCDFTHWIMDSANLTLLETWIDQNRLWKKQHPTNQQTNQKNTFTLMISMKNREAYFFFYRNLKEYMLYLSLLIDSNSDLVFIIILCIWHPLFCTLCPILGSPVQKRQGSPRRSPVEGHKDDKGSEASYVWEKTR